MSMCQCLIASGSEKGHRCRHPAKYPKNAPRFCGHHKNCKKLAQTRQNDYVNRLTEDEKILKEISKEQDLV